MIYFYSFFFFVLLKTELWLILSLHFFLPPLTCVSCYSAHVGLLKGVQDLGGTFCPDDAVFPSPTAAVFAQAVSRSLPRSLVLVSFLIARQIADEKPPQSGRTHLSSQLESTVPHGGGDADANNRSDLSGNRRFS